MSITYDYKEQEMNEWLDAMMSYTIALFTLLYANTDMILSIGGLVLLVIRLLADTPRAIRTIKGWFGVQERSNRRRTRRTPR